MTDKDKKRIAALRGMAVERIADVEEEHHHKAYVSAQPAEMVWLADLAAPGAAGDSEAATKVADLRMGCEGAKNPARAEAEVHLRATDLVFLCDLASPPGRVNSAPASPASP